MISVAGYCRVSTDLNDQANSFAAQQRYFREYINQKPDWSLYGIYADEGITGTSTKKRIQFNRMIQDAYAGRFSLILTKEVSRFSRNILDTISYTRALKSIGIGVFFITDRIHTLNPESEMLLSLMASLAQEESRRTSDRVVWGQTRQMEQGVVFGRSLLGYDVKNGSITVNPDGAEVVRLIFQKYAVEQVSSSEIARILTKLECPNSRGSIKWTASAIIRILKNEKYAGDLIQKKTYTPDFLTHEKKRNTGQVPLVVIHDHHEAIISREIWELAQERLRKNNKHRAGEGAHSNRYVFSGKIRCGECGASFVGRFRYQKDGTKVRRWSCGTAVRDGADVCDVGKLIRDDDAFRMVRTAMQYLPIDVGAIIRNVVTLAANAIHSVAEQTDSTVHRLSLEIDRIQKKKEAMMDSYFSSEISKEEMLSIKHRYDHQIVSLQARLEACRSNMAGTSDFCVLKSAISAEVTSILRGNSKSDIFCKTILHNITVYKDRHLELTFRQLPHIVRFSS